MPNAAEQFLLEGNLEQALADLQQRVRSDPANSKLRIFLFQLLAILGDWTRALNQLNVLAEMDVDTLAMVHAYRETLRCEALRSEVFAGQRLPLLFGDPEQWSALQFEALRLDVQGRHAEARVLLQQVFDQAPATSGQIDGQSFAWIADADTRLGPVLEAIIKGQYYWIPFHRIKAIKITPPEDLRDLVWLPAHFIWINGGEAFGFIPSRYPASEKSPENAIRLARKTEWAEVAENHYHGGGQRMLTTDQGDYPLLDIRDITLDTVAP